MKIRVFIVTYNRPALLKNAVRSLYASDLTEHDWKIFIINNYKTITLGLPLDEVTVLNNVCRPDFSTGHLARNWNQALLFGFENLDKPASDIVVGIQDDTEVTSNFCSILEKAHQKYNFISAGAGDEFFSCNAACVKTVGMWDERFNSIMYQEADYFLRCIIQNRARASIADFRHGRTWNLLESSLLKDMKCGYLRNEQQVSKTLFSSIYEYNLQLFAYKWGATYKSYISVWNTDSDRWWAGLPKSQIPDYCLYPYFTGTDKSWME